MKIHFVKSIFPLEDDGTSKDLGAVAKVKGRNGKRTLMIVLPCSHIAVIDTWNIEGIDTDEPSATPSIFCSPQIPCWHGYLTKGELKQV